ncbi:hypothetical protein BMMON2_06100 [Burkholderia mallei]
MRDRDDGAREAHEELLEPVDRFGVQVVGRFVEQQHVGLFEQQLAERDAALLAARQVLDLRVPRGRRSASAATSSCCSGLPPSLEARIASYFACSAASASKSASGSAYAA